MEVVEKITSLRHMENLLRDHPVLVIDFGAAWCQPCKKAEPAYKLLAEKLEGHAKFCKIDVDDVGCQDIMEKIQVSSVPTFIGFYRGEKRFQFTGADIRRLESEIHKLL